MCRNEQVHRISLSRHGYRLGIRISLWLWLLFPIVLHDVFRSIPTRDRRPAQAIKIQGYELKQPAPAPNETIPSYTTKIALENLKDVGGKLNNIKELKAGPYRYAFAAAYFIQHPEISKGFAFEDFNCHFTFRPQDDIVRTQLTLRSGVNAELYRQKAGINTGIGYRSVWARWGEGSYLPMLSYTVEGW